MELNQKEKTIFALLFASGNPLSLDALCEALNEEAETVLQILDEMAVKLQNAEFPVNLIKLSSSYQLVSDKKYADVIKETLNPKKNAKLSPAAMEVLAVIAYNQPVSKNFIEQVRGVSSSAIVNSLVERGLIEEWGRLEVPGRPIAYKTGENFLRCFGLSSLDELPKIDKEEISE